MGSAESSSCCFASLFVILEGGDTGGGDGSGEGVFEAIECFG